MWLLDEWKKIFEWRKLSKSEKKIKLIALFILIIDLFIGGFLIYIGITKPQSDKIEKLRATLEEKRRELVNNGIVYEEMSKYTDGEVYDLYVITKSLDPSFAYCEFDEFKIIQLLRNIVLQKIVWVTLV